MTGSPVTQSGAASLAALEGLAGPETDKGESATLALRFPRTVFGAAMGMRSLLIRTEEDEPADVVDVLLLVRENKLFEEAEADPDPPEVLLSERENEVFGLDDLDGTEDEGGFEMSLDCLACDCIEAPVLTEVLIDFINWVPTGAARMISEISGRSE